MHLKIYYLCMLIFFLTLSLKTLGYLNFTDLSYNPQDYMMKSQTRTLPTEIEYDILSRLPVKTLSRFKSVSKQWLTIITDPHFIKTHLHKYNNKCRKFISATVSTPSEFYSLDFKSPNDPAVLIENFTKEFTIIVSSCYGLLLIIMCKSGQHIPTLWNPSTGSYRKIPMPDNFKTYNIRGIGYDSTRDDFKIVMVVDPVPFDYQRPKAVHVFSSRTSSWKRIQDIPKSKSYHIFTRNVVLEGVPYWVGISDIINSNVSFKKYVIVYFDPKEDKMKELPSPEYQGVFELTVLGGNLCAFDNHEIGIDIWVMNNSSWSKTFALPRSSYLGFGPYRNWQCHGNLKDKSLCFTGENDSRVVIVIYSKIVIFNMKENTFITIKSPPGFEYRNTNVKFYVESLVSPYVGFGTRS